MTREATAIAPETLHTPPTWMERLNHVIETVREMSRKTDPQDMVAHYRDRVNETRPVDLSISLSRRDLNAPYYRITRCSQWKVELNPWKQRAALPLLDSGLLGELLWGDEARIIDDLEVSPTDPAYEYLAGHRSLLALPLFDRGASLNMVVLLRKDRATFRREELPDLVLTSNLFGRATHNLALSVELREAYAIVDEELKTIARIQRSLLPAKLPEIPTMQLAVHYETARRAGGDYYDLFELPDGKWGILIADVSGHGTPAAVLMAITHSLVHSDLGLTCCPGKMLTSLNRRLYAKYTNDNRTFVTAFYAVYDPAQRTLTYASAGHNPPRVKRCQDGTLFSLDGAGGLPLGVIDEESYVPITQALRPGDQIIFYTDGITEAMNARGEMFGNERLDVALEDCQLFATGLIERLLSKLANFTDGHPADDDRTVLVAKIA